MAYYQQRVFDNDKQLMMLGGPAACAHDPEKRAEFERIQRESMHFNTEARHEYMVALCIFSNRDLRVIRSKQ